jgi:hypothetical protein
MARYKYFIDEKNRKVIVVSTYAGKTVRGVAKAEPRDSFNIEKGKALAKARCDAKVAEKRAKRATKKINEARDFLIDARNYYEDMNSYYNDSMIAQTIAQEHLDDLIKTL